MSYEAVESYFTPCEQALREFIETQSIVSASGFRQYIKTSKWNPDIDDPQNPLIKHITLGKYYAPGTFPTGILAKLGTKMLEVDLINGGKSGEGAHYQGWLYRAPIELLPNLLPIEFAEPFGLTTRYNQNTKGSLLLTDERIFGPNPEIVFKAAWRQAVPTAIIIYPDIEQEQIFSQQNGLGY